MSLFEGLDGGFEDDGGFRVGDLGGAIGAVGDFSVVGVGGDGWVGAGGDGLGRGGEDFGVDRVGGDRWRIEGVEGEDGGGNVGIMGGGKGEEEGVVVVEFDSGDGG